MLLKDNNQCLKINRLIESIKVKKEEIKQTGLREDRISEALETLGQSQLIKRTQNNKEEIICLTQLGKDIASLVIPKQHPNVDLTAQYGIILEALFKEENQTMYKSDIHKRIKQKSIDKEAKGLRNKVYNLRAIDDLEKANLVEIEEKVIGNKDMVSLTSAGKEMGKLMSLIKQYNDSFFEFSNLIDKKIFCINDDILPFLEANPKIFENNNPANENEVEQNDEIIRSIEEAKKKLLLESWEPNQIKNYNQYRSFLIDFKHLCEKNFAGITLFLYSNIIKKNAIDKNKLALSIIRKILLGIFNERSENTIKNYEKEIRGYYIIRTINDKQNKSFSPEENGYIMRCYEDMQKILSTLPDKKIPSVIKNEFYNMRVAYERLLQDQDEKLRIIFE